MQKNASRFMDQPSTRYLAAVRTLQELLAAEGVDNVRRAASEVLAPAVRDEFQRRRQVTPSSRRHAGVCQVIGSPCGMHNPRDWEQRKSHTCAAFPAKDHEELWRHADGSFRYTTQPYCGVDMQTARELLTFCEQYGLMFHISPGSWHFPTDTTLIEVWRPMGDTDGPEGGDAA